MTNSISDEYKLIGIIFLAVLYFFLHFIWNNTNKAALQKYNFEPLSIQKSFRFLIISSSPFLLWWFLTITADTNNQSKLYSQEYLQIFLIGSVICVLAYVMILARKTSLLTALVVSTLLAIAWPIAVIHGFLKVVTGFLGVYAKTAGPRTSKSSNNWEKINQFHTHKNDYDAGRRRDPPPPIS